MFEPVLSRRVGLGRAWAIAVRVGPAVGLPALVGVAVFAAAFRGGSYSLADRSKIAVIAGWTIAAAAAFALWPRVRVPVAAAVAGVGLVGFAAWTGASAAWAPSMEDAYVELARVLGYAALFGVVVLAARRGSAARWADGLAAGIVLTAAIALVSRCFPSTFNDALNAYVPGLSVRLSFPVEYWNGLGIMVALGVPLLLRAAVGCRSVALRGLSLAPLPAFALVIYLTSSRGAVVTAGSALVVLILLADRRWNVFLALLVATAGVLPVVAFASARSEFVNGPLGTATAVAGGHAVALVVVLACCAVGLVYAIASQFLPQTIVLPRILGWGASVAALAVAAVAVAAAHPLAWAATFTKAPDYSSQTLTEHLFSASGSGRWQFWTAALDEWRTQPLRGRGAGTFADWWAAHGTLPAHIEDAHSLYAQTLGELGIVGLALLVVPLLAALAACARRLRLPEVDRLAVAAVTATFVGWLAANGIDWIWQLPAVGGVGVVVLGLIVGPASLSQRLGVSSRPARRALAPIVRLGLVALALAIVGVEAVPILAGVRLDRSRSAAAGGDVRAAVEAAAAARQIEPWAATPYLQLALAAEQAGDLRSASTWIASAARRDPENWQMWLVSARIETKLGDIMKARRDLRRAARLDAHAPLLGR